MSAPVRPEPDPLRPQRWRRWIEKVVDRDVLDYPASSFDPPPSEHTTTGVRNVPPRWLTLVVLVGVVLTTVGLLLVWQSWSNRSATPIDDQLPFLDSSSVGPADGVADSAPDTTLNQAHIEPEPAVDNPIAAAAAPSSVDVVVHIAGAVAQPGVVSLPTGSRVYQAIELAGGATRDADLDRVNLAAPLIDGERIHVPEVGEEIIPEQLGPPSSGAGLSAVPDPIDVNTAAAPELESLRGIGPSLAEAIVTTRVERGPFRSVDDLLAVPGIGEAKLAQIRDQVIVR